MFSFDFKKIIWHFSPITIMGVGGEETRNPPASQLFTSFESQHPFLDTVGIIGLAILALNFFFNIWM